MDKKQHRFFVTGISTDVGKTVVSAILAEALHAAYWKPVQAGDLDYSDSHKVKQWTTTVEVLPEYHRLHHPMSPHAAAMRDEVTITSIPLPEPDQHLLVEGAGGLLVPLNAQGFLIADQVSEWNLPVILVSRHYLGSINHTLLSVEVLKNRNIPLAGIIFVGDENADTESIVAQQSKAPIIGRVPMATEINHAFIQEQADLLREPLINALNHV